MNTIIENQRRLAANDPDNHVEIGSGYVPQDSPGEAEALRSAVDFFDAFEQGDYEYVYNSWGAIHDEISLEKFKQLMGPAWGQIDWRIENVEPYAKDRFLVSGTIEGPYTPREGWATQFIDSDGGGVYTVGPGLERLF